VFLILISKHDIWQGGGSHPAGGKLIMMDTRLQTQSGFELQAGLRELHFFFILTQFFTCQPTQCKQSAKECEMLLKVNTTQPAVATNGRVYELSQTSVKTAMTP
jgi:hypothetical protein